MYRLKELFSRPTAAVIALVLFAGWSAAGAADDRFAVELGYSGEVVSGSGTGFQYGSWHYYPVTDWLVQWFYNDKPNPDGKKIINVELTVQVLDSGVNGQIEAAVNWTTLEWPATQSSPPLPAHVLSLTQEQRYIERRTIVPRTDVRGVQTISASIEIEEYCPAWVSIDVRGRNVSLTGQIRHECVLQGSPVPPTEARDFGDAPEGALAYPSTGIQGLFPTCVGVGPASWIEHKSRYCYFGPKVDLETDGNAGQCPGFGPNQYNRDETQRDGDAGLIKPRAFTIVGAPGLETVEPTNTIVLRSLDNACLLGIWDGTIDIEVHNERPDGREAYVNILFDWNHDGRWQGTAPCPNGPVPEHALVNFPVPAGFSGALSELGPPDIRIGPLGGYVWARFTISDRMVPQGWNGDGIFDDGETEDYLLHVKEPFKVCDWKYDDPHKMHWAQTPDHQQTGLDVDLSWTSLADDFRCTQSGPITELHFWGSFLNDVLPSPEITDLLFVINIYSNRPADGQVPWSRPGELLWSCETRPFDFHDKSGLIKAGWFDPVNKVYLPQDHKQLVQYDFCFDDEDKPFVQRRGETYWLEIKYKRPEKPAFSFGWRTTEQRLQFGDKAVWKHPIYGWMPMSYPDGHQHETKALDLAFVVTGQDIPDSDYGDAPDPTYPTLAVNDGASHMIVPGIYLGARVDAEFDGQPNATATGDDSNDLDDEDGVVFSTLMPGEPANIQVTASTLGSLNAWIDWNADGDWDDAGEHVFVDRSLSAGVNTLALTVPAHAVPGYTFSRFRFSTVRGLRYYGPAADGEVEDYRIRIEGASPTPEPGQEHVKWSQPPIERDPDTKTPIYCGWDQPAYANRPFWFGSATWKIVADDFRCVGDMPITTVRWWGSYAAWQDNEPPRVKPASWRIAFWGNLPADTRYAFSRPGELLWLVSVPAGRVQEQRVGLDEFPRKPSDTAFQYLLNLESHEYFSQADFVDSKTTERIFWISITAVYTDYPAPEYPWGWKTRPRPWMDAAVKADLSRDDLRTGITLDPAAAQPMTESLCERLDSYDMTFELATNPEFIKWEQAFGGLRNWPHYEDERSMAVEGSGVTDKWTRNPDLTATGVDVDITADLPPTWPATVCGDDFECKTTGPITGITLWGSWYHDNLSSGSAENIEFTLSIREDIPAERSPTGYSMPGGLLWRKQFRKGQFTIVRQDGRAESYYSPANETYERNNHLTTYKYAFKIDPSEAFRQTGTPTRPVVYWLTAQAYLIHPPGSVATRFGWSTALDQWNDAAVWGTGTEPFSGSWKRLQYPRDHSLASRAIDLAFAIETEQAGAGLTLRRVVADDWKASGTTPVTGLAWWGSYIGYGYLPCDCTQMAIPRKPDYFMLSIWTDAADSAKSFNHPGQKVWEYKAEQYDEVLVGFDKHPEPTSSSVRGFEPVYRYSVRLPQDKWFRQDGSNKIYWLSVVAAYKDASSVVYPWGWTNHPRAGWDLPGLGMAGHWRLDETTGAAAADSSGNNNHGTLMGNPVWRPAGGWLAGAIELDGRDDYIKVERPKGFNFAPNSFSISAWIYPREARGRWHTILEYDRGSTANGNRFGLWLDVEGRLHFRVGQNTWQSPGSLVPSQWYHVAATYDAATRAMDVFIDGQLVATATQKGGFNIPNSATLAIGASGAGNDEFFYGLLDDVRVFTAALSEEDIMILAGAGLNGAAVAADFTTAPGGTVWPWTEQFDQTGAREDMSFVLFTRPWLLDGGATISITGADETESTGQKK